MTEELLIFLWKHRLYTPESLKLSDGKIIEVIHPGEHNRDAGPDFFNTRIKIEDTIWAGNAEIHVRASDWHRHGHKQNEAFNNVILHVVAEDDSSIESYAGSNIPTMIIHCNEAILAQYQYLLRNTSWIPCAKYIKTMDMFTVTLWLEKIGIERIEQKSLEISTHLEQTQSNWEEVLYRILARSFGFHLNSQPFELLAKSLPYKILETHAESRIQTEALLFGQAGFLNELISYDDYYNKLQKEYQYLAKKYSLKSIPKHTWKFLRLRPGNFPTIRMAQFAALIQQNRKLFAVLRDTGTMPELFSILNTLASDYWTNHYLFGKVSRPKEKFLGQKSVDILIINTVVPILFVYGKTYGLEQYQNRALDFLEQLTAEKNNTTDNWKKLGISVQSAFQSQALLQLKNEYCEKRRCLECNIGSKILGQLA